MTPMPSLLPVAAVALSLLVAGCAAAPESGSAPTVTPQAMVAAIRAAAGEADGELAVQPLRDPRVEDLRAEAARLEAAGDVAGAVRALDQALAVVEGDPALLQDRAELAVLQQDFALAARLAERAYALGAQVGPLCRRHWATLEQIRLRQDDAAGVASARTQIQGCLVTGPERY